VKWINTDSALVIGEDRGRGRRGALSLEAEGENETNKKVNV